jgi:uncharacterized protein YozE (UPF0346 family)
MFRDWLKRQKNRDDPIGDFATDMLRDSSFPIEDNLENIHVHLHVLRACMEAHVSLDEAWNAYKRKNKRNGISLKKRFEIFKRDDYRCQICGCDASDGVRLEIDHKTPIAKNGNDNIDNLWTLCFSCNRGKRTETI